MKEKSEVQDLNACTDECLIHRIRDASSVKDARGIVAAAAAAVAAAIQCDILLVFNASYNMKVILYFISARQKSPSDLTFADYDGDYGDAMIDDNDDTGDGGRRVTRPPLVSLVLTIKYIKHLVDGKVRHCIYFHSQLCSRAKQGV